MSTTLFYQLVKKIFESNMHNIKIWYLLWNWNSDCIKSVATQAIRLQCDLEKWEYTKRILLEKPNKTNCSFVKSDQVISLLDCLGKIVEKQVVEQLAKLCQSNGKLHKNQMLAKKYWLVIDTTVILV